MAIFQLFLSVQGTGGSLTGPDSENRVGDQNNGSSGWPVSSGLQVPELRTDQHPLVEERNILRKTVQQVRFIYKIIQGCTVIKT
jgi:hypothetical protein